MDICTQIKRGNFANLAKKILGKRTEKFTFGRDKFKGMYEFVLPLTDIFKCKGSKSRGGETKSGNGTADLRKDTGNVSDFASGQRRRGRASTNTDRATYERGPHVYQQDLPSRLVEDVKRGNAFFRGKRDTLRKRRYQLPDSPPQFRSTPINQTVSPGSPVSLKCSSEGSPSPIISWTRDDEPLLPTLRTRVESFRSEEGVVISHVNISGITVLDGGLFRCIARNAAGFAVVASRLDVYGPPFVRAMRNSSVVAGDDVFMFCPAGGFPSPTVAWLFRGHPVPQSLRHEILANKTLIIRQVKDRDGGHYTCVATGREGHKATADTFLWISNPPIIEEFDFAPNLKEGRRTQLTCMVTSGDLPITIHWLKNGHHLAHDVNVEQKQISDYSMVLLFKRLEKHHSGKYTCVAINAAASSNHTAELNVKVPPTWVFSPSESNVSVGGTITLQCMAKGVPDPLIIWSKSTGTESRDFVRINEVSERLHIMANGTLAVHSARKTDAANYLCEVNNGVGSPLSKIVKISISAQPEITSAGGRVTGHSGRTVKLECEARGDSPMVLRWRKGHRIISDDQRFSVRSFDINGDSQQSVLTLTETRQTDSGSYDCEAVNDHGVHTKTFDLVVLEPPSAPSNVKVEETLSRSAKLSWMTPQPAAITIQLKKGDSTSWSDNGRNISVGITESSFQIFSLSPFTEYHVRVFAANELGISSPSNVVRFVTQEEEPSGTPQNIRVTSSNPGSLHISWSVPLSRSVNGIIRGYVIAIREQNLKEDFRYITRPAAVHGINSKVEEYTIEGLSPNTLYEVSIKVFNRVGVGPLSSPRIVQATMFDAPECPPRGVSCKNDNLSGVRVWWEKPLSTCTNTPITGYSILATPTNKKLLPHLNSFTQEVFTTNLEKNLQMMPPSSNVSVVVRAYNNLGYSPPSRNIFCQTLDDVPSSPEHLRVVSSESGSFVAVWLPLPEEEKSILRYTLYYEYNNKVKHILVPSNDVDSTWKKVTGFKPGDRITIWVTASTSAGEGPPTPKMSLPLSPSSNYGPFAVSSRLTWKVLGNTAITLRCRGIGFPRPTVLWTKDGRTFEDDHRHQILSGGDLHLIPQSSANYTCSSTSSLGEDSLNFRVIVLTPPSKPILRVSEADRTSLNMSISCHDDGGVPILGYKLYLRFKTGQSEEKSVAVTPSSTTTSFVLRKLPCGSDIHFYAIAWNSQGSSPPSEELLTSTRGSPPSKPQPHTLVELNSTCVTLRLYAWPEVGCRIEYWRVEGKHEYANEWRTIFSKVGRESRDNSFCDLQRTEAYFLKIFAYSDAGPTEITYKITLQDFYSGRGTSQYVREIMLDSEVLMSSWFDAHIIAGILSAILLTTAVVICSCVVFRKRYFDRERNAKAFSEKESTRLAHYGGSVKDYHVYSPLPSKRIRTFMPSSNKKRKRSTSSLVSYKGPDQEVLSSEDVYPYATFSGGNVDESVRYGISLHTHSPSTRECFEGVQRSEDLFLSRKDRARTHFKESDVSYPPSISLSGVRGDKSVQSSTVLKNPELLSQEILKLNEAATLKLNERGGRDKEKQQRPPNRIQNIITLVPEVNQSNLNSAPLRNYNQSVPIQTLYVGHVKGSGGKRDSHSIASGQHARADDLDGPMLSSDTCHSMASFMSSSSLSPPSAFSDPRELPDAECGRHTALEYILNFPKKFIDQTGDKHH